MSMTTDNPLEAARDASRRRAWADAFALFSAADEASDLAPEDLEALAGAAWITGHYEEAFRAWERAYGKFREQEGGERAAALMAITLADEYYQRGELAVATGWQSSAERLLEGQPESRAHGLLAWTRSQIALLFAKDLDAGLEHARETSAIGRRLADADLEMLGLVTEGRALVRQGGVADGMRLIDEAMAAAVSGRVGPWTSCLVYCHTLSACQELGDYRRAGEWTETAQRCCAKENIVPASGDCRVHKAGILRLRGSWTEAEAEARLGSDEFRGNVIHAALAHYEIGEIRLRQGDFDGAEEAFTRAHELGRPPQPGLALLRLAQGKADAATQLIRQALSEETLDLARAGLLAAQIEIAVAAADGETARSAADELAPLVQRFGTPALAASLAYAEGAIALIEGDPAAAAQELQRSHRLWQEAGVPYEAARARMLLADVHLGRGDEDSAALELGAARQAFERLGAVPDQQRAASLLRSLGGAADAAAGDQAVRTFMFTDIVDSTPLVEAIGDEAWADLVRWHDGTLRGLFARHRGEEVDHAGDGFFVAFGRPRDAVDCAVDVQRTLAEHRRRAGFSPRVRIGVHTCPAIRRGRSYRGKGVHTAARISAQARGGEIVVSRETFEGSETSLRTSQPRAARLKGVAAPMDVVTVVWE